MMELIVTIVRKYISKISFTIFINASEICCNYRNTAVLCILVMQDY